MAILISGGCGFIGSHTCLELIKSGHNIVVFDDFSNSKPEVLRRLYQLSGVQFPFYECDMRDGAALDAIFAAHDIDTVVHFAGSKAVGESVALPLKYYDNNIGGTVSLLAAMARAGVKRMVFSSSATVYGGGNPSPLREDMPSGGCTNPYGRTKYMIEEILRDVCVSDPAFSAVLLRYFNPIGAHESGRIGEDPQDVPNNLMPYVAQVAVGKRERLTVFGNDYDTHDGTGVRDYIHVVDLARAHLKALESIKERRGIDYFNIGTGTGYSVLDIVKAYKEATGVEIKYEIEGRRPGDIDACFADPTKAREILGWTAEYDITDMCRDSNNWQKNNPNGYDC